LQFVDGAAYKTISPGKFTIKFNVDGSTTSGDYWIVQLGNIPASQTLYPWAMISTPFQTQLYILARDPKTFRSTYEEQALASARQKGFTYRYNRPLPTYQGDDCDYPPIAQP
jgi:lipocalin